VPLFNRFADIWGYSWTSAISDPDRLLGRMVEWESVIADLDDEEINCAVERCKRTCEFISPHKFRMAAFGITSADVAYANREGDRLSQKAWGMVDEWLKKTGAAKDVKRAFEAEYNCLVNKLLTGE